jgi:hypothetical protein
MCFLSATLKPRLKCSALALAFALIAGSQARAQIVPWLGGTGNWNSPTSNLVNWALDGTLPGATHTVTVNAGTVTVNTNPTIAGLTIGSGSGVVVGNGQTLLLSSPGALANSGSLTLSSTGSATRLVFAGDTTLSGSGGITLGNNSNNIITGSVGTVRLTNQSGSVIQGGGQLGGNTLLFTNQGTISANQSGSPLVIDPSSGTNTNSGTLRAMNGATLRLQDGTITNSTPGVIEAQTGSTVEINTANITGGNISVVGTGSLRLSNATLTNVLVTNSATGVVRAVSGINNLIGNYVDAVGSQVQVDNGATIVLGAPGTVTVNGGVFLNATAVSETPTVLSINNGGLTITGAGTLSLTDSPRNKVTGASSSATLTFGPSFTVRGAGQLGEAVLGITNAGTIRADQLNNALIVSPGPIGLTNTGTLLATAGGQLHLSGSAGTFENNGGNIIADGSSLVQFVFATVSNGNVSTTAGGSVALVDSFLGNVAITNGLNGTVYAAGEESAVFGSYTGAAGSQLRVNDGARLTISGGTAFALNGGNVTVSSTEMDSILKFGEGSTTVTGNGTFTLSGPSGRIIGESGSSLTLSSGITVAGKGTLGGSGLAVTNQGTVVANHEGGTLTVLPGTSGLTNNGSLRARDFGALSIQGGAVNNAGGTIVSEDHSRIDLVAATITGGSLTSSGSGHFNVLLNESNQSSTFSGLTISSGTLIEVVDGSRLTLNGTITNHGTLQLTGFEGGTELIIGAGGVTLTGSGELPLSNFSLNRIHAESPTTTLVNDTNHVIYGAGQIGDGSLQIDNRGAIDANINGGTLTLRPSGVGLTNSGALSANDGGILRLRSGTFTNTSSGEIFARPGSSIELDGATVQGGTLGGQMTLVTHGLLRNVTLDFDAVVQVTNNTTLTLSEVISGAGLIRLNATSSGAASVVIDTPGATFNGLIEMGNDQNNRISGASATTLFTNAGTIQGGGQLGNGSLALVNNGMIAATTATPLTINVTNPAGFINNGLLHASEGNMTVAHSFTNAGAISVLNGRTFTTLGNLTHSSGTISLHSGTLATTSVQTAASSIIQGSGVINGPVNSAGIIGPGSDGSLVGVGTLTFTHSVTLAPTSLLLLDLAGATSFDQIGAQSMNLNGGILALTFSNGYQNTILPTASFTLVTTTSPNGLTGTFGNVVSGRVMTLDGFGSFQVNYLSNGFSLSQFQAVPEPSTYVLLASGGAIVLLVQRRRSRRRS